MPGTATYPTFSSSVKEERRRYSLPSFSTKKTNHHQWYSKDTTHGESSADRIDHPWKNPPDSFTTLFSIEVNQVRAERWSWAKAKNWFPKLALCFDSKREHYHANPPWMFYSTSLKVPQIQHLLYKKIPQETPQICSTYCYDSYKWGWGCW